MALIGLKQLDSVLSGSLRVSGSSQVTGSLYVSSSMLANASEITDTLTVGGHLYISDSIVHSADTNTKIRFPEADTISFHTSGDERMRISTGGHITASGDVSSSATSTGSFGTVTGESLYMAENLYHTDDTDTYIGFPTGDKVDIKAGGINFMRAWQKDSDVDKLYFGYNEDPIDYIFRTDENNPGLKISGSGHITFGGNISGSATSTGSFGRVEADGVVYADSFQSVTGGNTIDFNDDVSLIGNLTASAHISASGNITGSDIYSSGRIYEQGSSVIDHATAMAIVFGG